MFDVSDEAHYRWLAGVLDDIGLERTVVAIIPDEAHSPISPEAAARQGAVDHLRRVIDCCAGAGRAGASPGRGSSRSACSPARSRARPNSIAAPRSTAQILPLMARGRDHRRAGAAQPLRGAPAQHLRAGDRLCRSASGATGIGILYDTFHANIEEKDPIAALRALHASGNLAHVHISENDRGTPGRGHAPIRETIAALKALGYDGWLTIEAFGRGVPELAAATRVWRDFFANAEEVYTEGYDFIRRTWDKD